MSCHDEQEELYAQVTYLTGCKAYGQALNVLMILEEKCPSSEVDILRQQLENIFVTSIWRYLPIRIFLWIHGWNELDSFIYT